jgi:organic hydroperoxide reductase OsmC/OhrA
MSVRVLYQTAARSIGGRDGRLATLDGTFEVSLTAPKELGGPGGDVANPEKLFCRRLCGQPASLAPSTSCFPRRPEYAQGRGR